MALTQVSGGGIKDGQIAAADIADGAISAQKLHSQARDETYTLGADGNNHYTFTGKGLTGAVNDPTLYLERGKTYRFVNGNSSGAHPFRIQTTVNGSAGTEYNTGVTNNGGAGGSTIVFEVPHAAPAVLYYQCTSHGSMGGIFYVIGEIADGKITRTKLSSGTIANADINASAAIAQSKLDIANATTSASGYMSAADKTKIDGIETGATGDQTASEIVALVAGQAIAPSTVYATSNIGKDAGDFISFTTDTQMDITINGNNEFRFEADGDFHADGDVIAFSTTTASDRRLKENIEVIPNALDKVQALNGVSFDWKKTGEKSAGVIAQEVQAVLPEAVKEVTPLKGGDSHLSVNYHALTSILIESIKELKAEIEELKGGK
tara:strand:- start:577 stop:1713 length:1137 start_codon:yes stop_codon:yes gene_type:complete